MTRPRSRLLGVNLPPPDSRARALRGCTEGADGGEGPPHPKRIPGAGRARRRSRQQRPLFPPRTEPRSGPRGREQVRPVLRLTHTMSPLVEMVSRAVPALSL